MVAIVWPIRSAVSFHHHTCLILWALVIFRLGQNFVHGENTSCDAGWSQFGYSCMQLQTTLVTFDDAVASCQAMGGRLVEIDSGSKESFIQSSVLISSHQSYWIGLRDLNSDNKLSSYKWITTNRSPQVLGYSNWDTGLSSGTDDNCTALVYQHSIWGWFEKKCQEQYYFICQSGLEQNGSCLPGWAKYQNSTCLKQFTHTASFEDALAVCHHYNASLAEIDNEEKENFIEANVTSTSYTNNWIGLVDTPTLSHPTDHSWLISGLSLRSTGYSKWYLRQPNAANQACVVIQWFDERWQWWDLPCSLGRVYICEKILPMPTTEPTTILPTTEKSTIDAIMTQEPTTNSPTTDLSTTNEPTTDLSATNEPTTDLATTNGPETNPPTANQASTDPSAAVDTTNPLIETTENSATNLSTNDHFMMATNEAASAASPNQLATTKETTNQPTINQSFHTINTLSTTSNSYSTPQISYFLQQINNTENFTIQKSIEIIRELRVELQLKLNAQSDELKAYSQGLATVVNRTDVTKASLSDKKEVAELVFNSVEKITSVTEIQNDSQASTLVTEYIQIMDQIGSRIASSMKIGESIEIISNETASKFNIEVKSSQEVQQYGYNHTLIAENNDRYHFGVSKSIFGSGDPKVEIITGVYQFLGGILNQTTASTQKKLYSQILSCSVNPKLPSYQEYFFTYQIPYTISTNGNSSNLPMVTPPSANNTTMECVYWNLTTNKWSDDGCKLLSNNQSQYATCACNHLTHFALLLQVSDVQINNTEHLDNLGVLANIGLAISLISICLTLSVYTFLRLNSERFTIHKNLLVALLLTQIFIFTGMYIAKNAIICKISAVCLHFFCLASFSWMSVEGIHLYLLIITVFNQKSKKLYYYIFGWGLPVIVVGISMLVRFDNYGANERCWLSTADGSRWAFVGPVLGITLINTIIMIAVIKVTVSSSTSVLHKQGKTKFTGIKSMVKATAILCPLLGLTWIFGMIPLTDHTIVFSYLFVIFSSLQGLSIFVFHCLYNSEVRQAFNRMMEKRLVPASLTKNEKSQISSSRPALSRTIKESTDTEQELRIVRVNTMSFDESKEFPNSATESQINLLDNPGD